MNNSPLLNHYQAWLDDFTRVSLFHGLCQKHISQWHRLAITACPMPGSSVTEVVIPQCLLRLPAPVDWDHVLSPPV